MNKEDQKKTAKKLFNNTWDLLEKEDRTIEEDFEMIHTAHASAFHWYKVGTPLNFARGEWQISRVYSVLKRPDEAIIHGQRSLDICLKNHIKDFDLSFAYESLARAYAVKGDSESSSDYYNKALESAEYIEKKEDRDYFISDLKTVEEFW